VLSETLIWQFNPSPADVQPNMSNMYEVTIATTDLAKARMQTLTLHNAISYGDQVFNPEISFDVEFLHPCRRTTFNDVTINTISYQLRDGTALDSPLDTPTDEASLHYSTNSNGWNTCGDRTYSIVDANNLTPTWVTAVNEAAVADGNGDLQVSPSFIIRVEIDDESYVAGSPHTMTLTVGFATYPVADDADHPTRTYTFDINVLAPVCDCTLITWNEPENIPLLMNAMVVTTPAT